MKFSKFKKEYRSLAKAATPDCVTVHKTADNTTETLLPCEKKRAFRFALPSICIVLALIITLGATGLLPKPFRKTLLTAKDRPSLSSYNSYKEIDRIFTNYEKEANKNGAGEYIEWGIDEVETQTSPLYSGMDLGEIKGNPSDDLQYSQDERGDDYSDTNTQTEGIDEADIIKTDGKFIYFCDSDIDAVYTDDEEMLRSKKISIFNVSDPANIELVDNIIIREYFDSYSQFEIEEMYLNNGVLTLIFTTSLSKAYYRNENHFYAMQTGALVFDVSDPYNAKHMRTYMQEGIYKSSRSVGGYIYFVTSKNISRDCKYSGDPKSVIPKFSDSVASTEREYLPPECIYITETDTRNFNIIGAVSITDHTEHANVISVLGNCYTLYSSIDSLYICDNVYKEVDGHYSTYTDIYKFHFSGNEISFVNSNTVIGDVLNQFSLDEYKGYLRVATTLEFKDNGITILDENMNIVGELRGLAQGERIYSARFTGDTGYVVTFRTVDPLFTFDLSDPSNPKVTGELKMPGYSEYLHPYSENILIGIGQDASETDGLYQGLKISLFDVTDDFNPKEIDNYYLGNRGTSSPIEANHKALAYYPSKDVFGFPVTLHIFPEDKPQSHSSEYAPFDSYAFAVLSANGGSEITEINLIKQYDEQGRSLYIQRGLFIGDNVFTISDDMIQSNNILTGEFIDSETF